MISRRDILESVGVAGCYGVAGVGVMAVSKAASCASATEAEPVPASPEARVKAALAELKDAIRAAHPGVVITTILPEDEPRWTLAILAYPASRDAAV